MTKKTITADAALKKAASYCSKSEHCVHEVREKLHDWGLDNREDEEHIIDWLKSENYIDEVRFVHAFVHDKLEFGNWGRTKISYQLQLKQISTTLINEVLNELIEPDKYFANLTELLRTKAKDMERPFSPQDHAKLQRFGAQRGFESVLVGKAIESL